MEIFHRLKLYGDGEPTQQSTKKPVCSFFVACRPTVGQLSCMAACAHNMEQRCMHT